MTTTNYIISRTGLPQKGIENTLQLLQEDATIPFISRYRKEMTGNLDEVQIAEILKFKTEFEDLEKRKKAILKAISEQEVLTPELESKILAAEDLLKLEDLYLPYKKKRKTKADAAREQGLEPLAKMLMAQNSNDIEGAAKRFVSNDVIDVAAALQGAKDIAAEWINEHEGVRNRLRKVFEQKATISSKVVKKKAEEEAAQKYRQYFEWEEKLKQMPSHRLLAMLRAEKEGFVRVKVEIERRRQRGLFPVIC